jgi:hypothetical protein
MFFQKAFRVREIHTQYNMFEFADRHQTAAAPQRTAAPAQARSVP